MVITIASHVERCYSNQDGAVIMGLIRPELRKGRQVVLSFKGINSISTSFTNTALIELLDDFDFDFIKQNVHFTDTNRHINQMIKDRFESEVRRRENDLVLS